MCSDLIRLFYAYLVDILLVMIPIDVSMHCFGNVKWTERTIGGTENKLLGIDNKVESGIPA